MEKLTNMLAACLLTAFSYLKVFSSEKIKEIEKREHVASPKTTVPKVIRELVPITSYVHIPEVGHRLISLKAIPFEKIVYDTVLRIDTVKETIPLHFKIGVKNSE